MNRGCQSLYDKQGNVVFEGEWDPKAIAATLTSHAADNPFSGKRVLDIGANTGGLSLEIARMGAEVVASEPDPYKNTMARSSDLLLKMAEEESLKFSVENKDLFSCHLLGEFDIVLCLGLIYHFRYPQYLLDYLSSLHPKTLFISTQTHPSSDLALFNRRHPGVLPKDFLKPETILTGWHPTRPLFELMLQWAGFEDVVSLTDKDYNCPSKQPGLTNSAYYRARCVNPKDPEVEKAIYYPR